MGTSVFCIVPSEAQAVRMVTDLKAAGFSNQDISVLFPDKSGTRDFAHEQHTKAPEGAVTGVAAGGAVGGIVGLLAGMGTLVIPGVGALIAAGPILGALSGAAVGATVGGITGALIGMGVPEFEAKRYEGKIASGNLLISVHTEDSKEFSTAKDIFQRCGGLDIASGGESRAPVVETRDPRGAIPPPITNAPPII